MYILTDVGNSVHPAPHPHLVPDIGGVAVLMNKCNVVWVRSTEQLSFQSQWVNLKNRQIYTSPDIATLFSFFQMKISFRILCAGVLGLIHVLETNHNSLSSTGNW